MRPILHPRAASVVGHRAKDELTTASGCRQARATASVAPTRSQCGQFRPSFSPGPRPNGSMMSGSALHQRSNPTRWASGGGHGGECFARKRQWVREAVDGLGTSAFRRPCAAGPAIPMATRRSRAPGMPDERNAYVSDPRTKSTARSHPRLAASTPGLSLRRRKDGRLQPWGLVRSRPASRWRVEGEAPLGFSAGGFPAAGGVTVSVLRPRRAARRERRVAGMCR